MKILTIGKTKEKWLQAALEEYQKRLTPYDTLTFHLVKDNEQLINAASKEKWPLFLDEKGSQYTSETFSAFLFPKWEEASGKLTFIIGGADGLPPSLKNQKPQISLSPLTFPNQLTRLILLEQIYRAFSIAKGLPYHRS